MPKSETGMALLEVMLALTIVAVAVPSTLRWLTEGMVAMHTASEREKELVDEERLLMAYTLLTSRDLGLRLGFREVGPYLVSVQRPEPNLFRIALSRRGTELEDLVTVIYRREEQHAR